MVAPLTMGRKRNQRRWPSGTMRFIGGGGGGEGGDGGEDDIVDRSFRASSRQESLIDPGTRKTRGTEDKYLIMAAPILIHTSQEPQKKFTILEMPIVRQIVIFLITSLQCDVSLGDEHDVNLLF